MARSAADQATEAAEVLSAWLDQRQSAAVPGEVASAPAGGAEVGAPPDAAAPDGPAPRAAAAALTDGEEAVCRPAPSRHPHDGPNSAAPLRLPHADWLQHRLTISGPEAKVAAFRQVAAGAGIVPWQLDVDALAEDWFLLLAAPPAPQQRTLSLAGARVLAGPLHEVVAARQAAACAPRAQPRLSVRSARAAAGARRHPASRPRSPGGACLALAALGHHRGAAPCRRGRRRRSAAPGGGETVFRVDFWSADWTPWRALLRLREVWPALRFDIRPSYDAAGAEDR